MGLPLYATVGEERTLSEEFSLADIQDVVEELGYDSTVGNLTVQVIKRAFAEIGKALSGIGSALTVISISSTIASKILKELQKDGFTGIRAEYTYRYDLLYGDPTTVPRWQLVGFEYSLV